MVKKGLPLLGLIFMTMKELFLVRSDRVREKKTINIFLKKNRWISKININNQKKSF